MRIRLLAFAALTLLLATFVTLAAPISGVRAQDDGTPEADGTPVADEDEGDGEEEADSSARIVTLIGWYSRDESGDFLVIGPIEANQNLVAGPVDDAGSALTGSVDFDSEANNDLPRIEVGDSVLDAFPVSEDDPSSAQRWLFFNDDPELRPGTLVMQVEATEGVYEGAVGTATFISRDQDGNGVIVIVLNLPEE